MMQQKFTDDYILNGKISIRQPKKGYRVAIDPIILASFVKAKNNQTVLDVGCGVGTISLILKLRNRSLKITAVDIDENMCKLCQYNSEKNHLELNIINTDIEKMLNEQQFDCVVTNPPFFAKESSRISKAKMLANFETIELSKWIDCCLKKLKSKGTFFIIHNASRINDILQSLNKRAGDIKIIPIFPKNNSDAIRVIVIGTKGSRAETKISYGIVLHNDNGEYSDFVKNIFDE